ncbi:hypothetical protein PYW08_006542 [Mythimna loreyi]|uniref:Uncharacterized protein n=3 Tax=Mythimna loreyi TaxID=667449 RepID=A0ACC2QP06_9NEOP|nr:hypothetical protein PYW08_006234 [Mythimna loreyi]KAJ8721077.1 hypothetical protein PYW08_006542 [Mythimna loreyi]
MERNIDPDQLITLVQDRGVLWDKTLNDYKNKQLKIAAWREVCCILIPNFDNLDEKERQSCGKLVSTKWSNLRDAWMRANKNEVKKSGAGAKFSKPYIYKEQMSFLQKVAEPNRTHDSVKKRPPDTSPEPSAANTTDMYSELPLPSTSKKPKTLDDKMSQFLDSRLQPDRSNEHPMLSFFKGILPSVTSFDDSETLEFQSGVLSLIQNIKKQRESRLYSSNYGWHSQSRGHEQQSVYSSQNQNVHPPLNHNILPSIGYGYSTRQLVEPASPTLSQHSSITQDSDLDFSNL